MPQMDDTRSEDQKTPLPPTRRRRAEAEKRESKEFIELAEKGLRENKDLRESDPDGIMKPLE